MYVNVYITDPLCVCRDETSVHMHACAMCHFLMKTLRVLMYIVIAKRTREHMRIS